MFNYRRIDASLIQEFADLIDQGESIVMLGSRYAGKKQAVNWLEERLVAQNSAPVVRVDIPHVRPIKTERDLSKLIADAVRRSSISSSISQEKSLRPTYGFFKPIDEAIDAIGKPIILLASYVDSLTHTLARQFLRAIRSRVMGQRSIIAFISGETNLQDLVVGPNSEFNCTNNYFLQGFSRDQFALEAANLETVFHARIERPEATIPFLYEVTGGNVSQLRTILAYIAEEKRESTKSGLLSLSRQDLPSSLLELPRGGISKAEVFWQATKIINHEPDCWHALETLIAQGATPLPGLENDPPTRLELAGVTVREKSSLVPASRLMMDYVRQYYTPRRIGDLNACAGNWERAFEKYRELNAEEYLRPDSNDDRANVSFVVNALGNALYSAATIGPDHVGALFMQGCQYILGFKETSFWQHNCKWELAPSEAMKVPTYKDKAGVERDYLETMQRVLPKSNQTIGPWPLPDIWSHYGMVAILPSIRRDKVDAICISNFVDRTVISRERKLLAEDLLKNFISAYSHAIAVEQEKRRRQTRDRHVQVINTVFEALGQDELNVVQMLTLAARELRHLGYSRVLFCLVDPERKRIKGVVDDSDDPCVDVKALTDYPLDEPLADVQPFVIFTKQYKIIENALEEPLTNKTVVVKSNMKAEAIVPIINNDGEAIGTIHIERADRAVPLMEEVEDLLLFGSQLAVAIELCDRVNILQAALNKIPEPIGICDQTEKLIYLNKPAAKVTRAVHGWQEPSAPIFLSDMVLDNVEIAELVRESLRDGKSRTKYLSATRETDKYHIEVVSAGIQSWDEKVIATIGHIRDLSKQYTMFKAFQNVTGASDSETAMRSLLEAIKILGYEWGRLYLVDPNDPDSFISTCCFGFKNPENETRFNRGEVKLHRREVENSDTWRSFVQNEPLIFQLKRNAENDSVFMTEMGLKVTIRNETECQTELEKEDGSYWIDLPIGTDETPLGKLSVGCNEKLPPYEFELIKVLTRTASDYLVEIRKRDQMIKIAVAEKVMAAWAHNIATRLASLPILLARFRNFEQQQPKLKGLNDRYAAIVEDALNMMLRVKERVTPVEANLDEVDVIAQIRYALETALPDSAWQLHFPERRSLVKADRALLRSAILELVQNSIELIDKEEGLRVEVSVQNGDGNLVIRYRDNGPGVPREYKERIFDEFFSRRPGQKTSTGLGLSYVRRVVKAHGGTIEENGVYGQGAAFEIRLPKVA